MYKACYAVAMAAILSIALAAQAADNVRDADIQMYPDDVSYDPAIPTPDSVLGFELGRHPVRHPQLVDYINRVAALSDRMSVEVIGYTHERRPILFLTVTSPQNHSRIDAIKARHVALSEPGSDATVSDDMPIVTWINYGVHGAESSGMDASLPFIYYLAAAQGSEFERVLDTSIILVTAIFNPDGHAKRASWFDTYGGEQIIADPGHIEHQFNWQLARTNHYWFDLNRQWLLLTQPEAQAWMAKWHEWRPNLTVDYHEMGSDQTYYFHPGVATRTNPLVPDEAERLMAETVKTSEAFLDSEGRLYYHGERFDNFYIGKGSTFPLVNGGVGVLYEAAAALGREIETPNGLRTYRENIRKHFRTSIASIEAGANLRLDYLRYQRDFYLSALDDASSHATKGWVFAAPGDPARLNLFAEVLNQHRIRTYRLGRDIEVDGREYAANDALIVPMDQAQYRLIRGIFETSREFEDATFYDVSTWTMPPAFGLQYAALAGRNYRSNLLGAEYSAGPTTAPLPTRADYGYVIEWNDYYAPRALQRVLDAGLLARVATRPFEAATSEGNALFAVGSIVVPYDRQEKDRDAIYDVMRTIAEQDGITVHSLTSGRSVTGTAGIDAGGASFRPIEPAHILLVVGNQVNLYDAGEIWHLLDYRMQIPVSLRSRETLTGIDWSRYTHIVFAAGDYDEYEAEYAPRLRQWVNEGGTVIGMHNAAPWIRANTLDWVDPLSEEGLAQVADPLVPEGTLAPAEDTVVDEPQSAVERQDYSEKDDFEAVELIGGAIFAADLDTSHPLGFGYDSREIFLHKNFSDPLLPPENPFATVIAYADEPVYSGYVSDTNSEALAGTPALIAERIGLGSVILFADNPNFRGYWYGTNKLFLNALFFSTVFDPQADY